MGSGSSGGGLRNLPGGQLLVKGQPCKGSGSGALEDHSHGQRLGAGPQEEAHAPQVSVFTSHKPNQQTAKSNRFCPLTLTTHLPKDNYPPEGWVCIWKPGSQAGSGSVREASLPWFSPRPLFHPLSREVLRAQVWTLQPLCINYVLTACKQPHLGHP